jgi:nucleotide-binding universal stress UspA family protein
VDAERAGARFSDRPGFGLTTYLSRHGAKARVKQVAASGGIADTILDQVAEEKADLLVMGGYGHSRVREMMFGGVTRSILETAPSPILVSH